MWFAFAILVFFLRRAVKSYQTSKVPKGVTNFIEVLVVFVRDEIAKPTIHKDVYDKVEHLIDKNKSMNKDNDD